MPPFHGDSGTIPRTVKHNKIQKQPPFTMAIQHSRSTPTTLPPNYCIKYIALGTIISIGHNFVWHYCVALPLKWNALWWCVRCSKLTFSSIVHNTWYYIAVDPVLECFCTVYSRTFAQYTVDKTRFDCTQIYIVGKILLYTVQKHSSTGSTAITVGFRASQRISPVRRCAPRNHLFARLSGPSGRRIESSQWECLVLLCRYHSKF